MRSLFVLPLRLMQTLPSSSLRPQLCPVCRCRPTVKSWRCASYTWSLTCIISQGLQGLEWKFWTEWCWLRKFLSQIPKITNVYHCHVLRENSQDLWSRRQRWCLGSESLKSWCASCRFHVYPRAFNTFVASKDAAPEDWHDKLANFNLVARVFIVNAIRSLDGLKHQTTTAFDGGLDSHFHNIPGFVWLLFETFETRQPAFA